MIKSQRSDIEINCQKMVKEQALIKLLNKIERLNNNLKSQV